MLGTGNIHRFARIVVRLPVPYTANNVIGTGSLFFEKEPGDLYSHRVPYGTWVWSVTWSLG